MQLNPSEEKWFAPGHSPSSDMAKALKSPSAPVGRYALARSQGGKTVLLGFMAGQEWGKGKPKVPLPAFMESCGP